MKPVEADSIMKSFTKDAASVLEGFFRDFSKRIGRSDYSPFYLDNLKESNFQLLGLRERVLVERLFFALLDKHCLLLEYPYSNNHSLHADMAMWGRDTQGSPEIMMEFKWFVPNTSGEFGNGARNLFLSDVEKLRKENKIRNKYFMHLFFWAGEGFSKEDYRKKLQTGWSDKTQRDVTFVDLVAYAVDNIGFEDTLSDTGWIGCWKVGD